MPVTTMIRPTIDGPQATPITLLAAERLNQTARGGTPEAGLLIWARLLDAQRDVMNAHECSDRTHDHIGSYQTVHALSLVMVDIYGLGPIFWKREAAEALNTPAGDYVWPPTPH
jgi:hypothetical protein